MFSTPQPASRFGLLLMVSGLAAVAGMLLLFAIRLDDGAKHPSHGQDELACAKAKLEATWGVELPGEIANSLPGSQAVSAGWELEELGCSGAIHPTATLDEIFGTASPTDLDYTAAIPSGLREP
jgi:hypothetical protein